MSGNCPACRRPLEPDAAFCPHCGQSFERMAERDRALRRRSRLRWLFAAAAVALVLTLASFLAPEPDLEALRRHVADLEGARLALEEEDWVEALRLLSPTGQVPGSARARRLWADAWHLRCLAEGSEALDRAARARELALADRPQDLDSLRARAELESSFGDPARAVGWWEAALQVSAGEERHDLLLDTAVARAVAGELGAAELLLEELLAQSPRHVRGLTVRGLLHLAAGRLGLAETDLMEAVRRDPDFHPARAGLAETHRLQGRAEEALAQLEALGEARGQSVTALETTAFLAEAEGNAEEAAAAREAARQLLDRPPSG